MAVEAEAEGDEGLRTCGLGAVLRLRARAVLGLRAWAEGSGESRDDVELARFLWISLIIVLAITACICCNWDGGDAVHHYKLRMLTLRAHTFHESNVVDDGLYM